MSIHKYQAFSKVAELGSITKAAEAMGYTQSAVSRMIADLEDEWNLNLLRRSRGGLALSSDGLMLLPYIRDLCSHYDVLQEQANALKGLETGFIRIGSCASVSTQCLPPILKTFVDRYPDIIFQLQNMEYSDTEEALCAGVIDCGFICAPFSPELDVTVLMRDRMLAVLPPDHPLTDAKSYPLQQLSQERIIKLTDEANNEVSKIFTLLNSKLDRPISAYCDVNDDYSIMAMVESGLGVSILSELVTHRMPFDVCLKEFDPPQYRDIAIAVKKGRKPSPATEKFIQIVLEFFSNYPDN
ncbi:MAG: LysR family transcriptional regulator [Oscillospiraceae bacterium]|nr:LysR family transcriptional regulator [Oscillospiraceae bacterium]